MSKLEEKKDSLSRRKFLITAGTVATGLLATGLAGCSAPGNTESKAEPVKATGTDGKTPALPWKYNKLDVDKVRQRGYENYFKHGCCYGAASALLETLVESSGAPWDTIPKDMFQYGAGGAYSWGTLCGALNSSLAIMNLASAAHANLGNELLGWYTKFPFPTNKHDAYAKIKNQVTTVANSPLCHISVSTWADKAGEKINEAGKADRCAKVTGDTAARAAEMLNEALEKGKIVPMYRVPTEYSHCMACHQGPNSLLDDQQGKMNCLSCHDDHTKKK